MGSSISVTIKLYDTGGQPVITLLENKETPAKEEQSVSWDGKNQEGELVANGIYFFVITTDRGERAVGQIGVLR